ncbi:hypothetical protein HNR06_003524 [Nocardiopsis arvandica]|uniref:Transcriptional regulator n=1 Tax=Nocardiopsis sinuspersici TaxID=501010 RepID=A0A7Y9XG00_9ACTN|nr:endonuclease domain-containing protein [Nocardiopsis sinuspersici]NYH53935.1 hypothetical protein [Nocardiopsis sinuspersici]
MEQLPPRPGGPLPAATGTAVRQYGVLSWQQARAHGLRQTDIRCLLRGGEWGRPYRQVYAVRSLLPPMGSPDRLRSGVMAAQLALGPHAFAAGETAALLWGMQGLPRWDGREAHMVVPALGAQRHVTGITLHSWDTPAEELTEIGGCIRVTRPGRTLRDTLLRVDRDTAVCLMDSALNQGLVRQEEFEELERANRRRRGCVNVRRWWSLADSRSQSALETRIRLVCVDGGLPPDELQRRFVDGSGRTLAVVDFWWEASRLIGEADGLGPHSSPRALARDRERQNALQRWYPDARIVRFTWQDLRRPEYILAAVAGTGS